MSFRSDCEASSVWHVAPRRDSRREAAYYSGLVTPLLLTAITLCALAPAAPVTAQGLFHDIDRLRPGRSMRASSSDPNWHNGNADARPIAPGATLAAADLVGPGRINHIWNTINASERGASRLVVIRMYWDGEGDDFFFIDGENEPSLRGTGSEDYFCNA